MTTRRPLARRAALLACLAAVLCSGCAQLNDRFYVPGRDPLMLLLGADYETTNREWGAAASLPDLPPMRTELIPDRRPPPAVPSSSWPPL